MRAALIFTGNVLSRWPLRGQQPAVLVLCGSLRLCGETLRLCGRFPLSGSVASTGSET
jgi:hypothetical protein